MGHYYYHRHRRTHYRPELVFPVAMAAIFLVAVLVAFVSWMIPDDPAVTYSQQGLRTQKTSRLEKLFDGIVRAVKETVQDDQN
jgi:hypothetical protein